MANLLITNKCNQRCTYCFAGSYLQNNANSIKFLSENSFIKYLDFLDRSGINQVRLLGGEPSLHPSFSFFLEKSIERDKNIIVFTNGLLPNTALKSLLQLPIQEVKVLVNVTPASKDYSNGLKKRQLEVLDKLGQRAYLGYTIYQPDIRGLHYLISIINQTNCQRTIRIGLSHPSQDGNSSLSPKHYRRVAIGLMQFIRIAYKYKVVVEFDCGFVRCMFTENEINELIKMGTNVGWHCNPLIDIDFTESAVPCFPLSTSFRIPNSLFKTESELIKSFTEETSHLRIVGIFPECNTCSMKILENCSGGCLSSAINRLHKNDFQFQILDLNQIID